MANNKGRYYVYFPPALLSFIFHFVVQKLKLEKSQKCLRKRTPFIINAVGIDAKVNLKQSSGFKWPIVQD